MSGFTPYKSGLSDSQHFRVVRVAAGRWHEPIRCELVERKLGDASGKHPYRALSYVWGSSSVTDTIFLGGHAFRITLNLSCALRHLRKADEDAFLWVDALCINQRDYHERSLQVGIMQSIYKNACEVVVFMGDGRDHRVSRSQLTVPPSSPTITLRGYEQGKSFLTEMLRLYRSGGKGKSGSSETAAACAIVLISLFSDQDSVEQGCSELVSLNDRTRSYLFECLRAYVTCPWWSRIWVVQEIAVGTAITIQYGTITLSWDALVSTAKVWSSPKARQMAASMGIEPENVKVFTLFANQLNGLEQTRRKWRAEGGDDLVRLLQEFSDRHASDDRDKVYGLLSLVKKDQRYIKPNYELDVFETYRATALALIGKGGSLACWAGDQKRKFNRGLPSWIPDWSTAMDTGDKRRMDLFESYTTNGDWSLQVIEAENEYWYMVDDQMELLMNSPAAKSGRLPASLGPFVKQYVELLRQRAKSLEIYRIDADELEQMGLDSLPWALWPGITPSASIRCLTWCNNHEIYPRSGMSLLKRWIRNLENPRPYHHSEDAHTYNSKVESIRQSLLKLMDAMGEEDLGTGLNHARSAIYSIEAIVLEPETLLGIEISLAIEGVIDRCWKLADLCKAKDNGISPAKLFQVSYSLQGSASWLTEYQYEQAKLTDWGIGLSQCMNPGTSQRVLPIQTVLVDIITWRAPRHFGWADTESGLSTLMFWLYYSGAVVSARGPDETLKDSQLNHKRVRQFARTIIGGMRRHDGSYRQADGSVLDILEKWLRQCLTVHAGGWSGWALPDPETGKYVSVGDLNWVSANDRYGIGWLGAEYRQACAAVPSLAWVQRALATIGFPVPPSDLFEEIQIATDGRVFFMTENGSMGLGPASIRAQDMIHILPSGRAHFVLRSRLLRSVPRHEKVLERYKASSSDECELIGDCYLHTEARAHNQGPAGEEQAIEGSLPFELLGARYLVNSFPKRKTVLLV